ncbi:Tyr recombinase domain-containing protein [Gammaproteobacteria bacterium]
MKLLSMPKPISAPEEKGIVGNYYWRGRSLWIDYSVHGERFREPILKRRNDDSKEVRRCEIMALKVLHKRDIQIVEDKFFDIRKRYDPKFWRIAGRYWKYHLSLQKSAKVERYKIVSLLKKWGRTPASRIDANDVILWMEELKNDGYQINAINNRFAYFHAIIHWALRESQVDKRLDANPILNVKALRGGKVRKKKKVSGQFERELEAARPCFRPLYFAAWESGCRPEELFGLEWENVDMEERLFIFPADHIKTFEDRVVPISDMLFDVVKDLHVKRKNPIVFPNNEGRRYTRQGIRWDMAIIRRAIGDADIWFRDTRKEFVSRKISKEKIPIPDVMAVTGHKTYSTIKRYCLDKIDDMRRVVGASQHPNVIEFESQKRDTSPPQEGVKVANLG